MPACKLAQPIERDAGFGIDGEQSARVVVHQFYCFGYQRAGAVAGKRLHFIERVFAALFAAAARRIRGTLIQGKGKILRIKSGNPYFIIDGHRGSPDEPQRMKKQKTKNDAAPAVVAPALTPEVKSQISEWSEIKKWLSVAKTRENEIRQALAAFFVPNPKEGTNNVQGEGFAVKLSHTVSRKLDEAALDAVMPQLPEQFRVIGNLISYKPTFSLEVYRAMSAEEKKIFEQALTINEDGTPTLEIVFNESETPAEPAVATVAPKAAKPAPVVPKKAFKPAPVKKLVALKKPTKPAPAKKPAAPKKGGMKSK